jgi:hypothetical protein
VLLNRGEEIPHPVWPNLRAERAEVKGTLQRGFCKKDNVLYLTRTPAHKLLRTLTFKVKHTQLCREKLL